MMNIIFTAVIAVLISGMSGLIDYNTGAVELKWKVFENWK